MLPTSIFRNPRRRLWRTGRIDGSVFVWKRNVEFEQINCICIIPALLIFLIYVPHFVLKYFFPLNVYFLGDSCLYMCKPSHIFKYITQSCTRLSTKYIQRRC